MVFLLGQANLRAHDLDGNVINWDVFPFMCTKSHLENHSVLQLRTGQNVSYNISYVCENNQRIEDVGWHFSWMGDFSNRFNKATSFRNIELFNNEQIERVKNFAFSEGLNAHVNNEQILLKKYDTKHLPQELFNHEHIYNYLLPNS